MPESGSFIDENRKVTLTLKTVFAFALTSITCTGWIYNTINVGYRKVEVSIMAVQSSMDSIQARVTAIETNRYRISDASEQALRLAIENPGMRVPDPRDTSKIIVVETKAKGTE